MRLIHYFKELHAISKTFTAERHDLNRQLDSVKIELANTKAVTSDIQKDIANYQFQVQPRIELIQKLTNKIEKELSK